jgi:hypothetical protein
LSKKYYSVNPLESEHEEKPKPKEASAAFPPMAASAPKPFAKSQAGVNNSSFPPMSSSAPKPFGVFEQTKSESNKSNDVAQKEKSPLPEKKEGSMGFGSLFSSLPTPSYATANSPDATSAKAVNVGPSESDEKTDYHKILTQFYEKHNPAKVTEVHQTLEKYKGKENEMFKKLAQKYQTNNPLDDSYSSSQSSQQPESSFGGFGSTLPGQNKPSPFTSQPAMQTSPFGNTVEKDEPKSPFPSFGSQTTAPFASNDSKSPFGSSSAAPAASFGNSSSTGFGGFGGAASSFGQGPSPFSKSPFGSDSSSAQSSAKFGGRNPRDLLVSFYQSHNPAKVAEVDKTLAKYAGKEELLFLNLAKKYNVDPAQFGVNASQASAPSPTPGFGSVPASTFGSQSQGFGAPSFGAPAVLGGGSGGFGSAPAAGFANAGPSAFGSSVGFSGGFGSLAAASGGSAFGAAQPSSSTPFGAARR